MPKHSIERNLQNAIQQYSTLLEKLKKIRSVKSGAELYPINCAMRIKAAAKSTWLLVKNKLIHDATCSLRALFEALLCFIGYFRIPNFVQRRHIDLLEQQVRLCELRIKLKSFYQNETAATVGMTIKEFRSNLKEEKSKGLQGFRGVGEWEKIAFQTNFLDVYMMYYRLLCMDTHPTSGMLQDYVRIKSNGFLLIDNPSQRHPIFIQETLINLLVLASTAINEFYKLGVGFPTIQNCLEKLKQSHFLPPYSP